MIAKKTLGFYKQVETIINGAVSLVVNVIMYAVTTLAPAMAPIPPAYSVYKALSERLDAPMAISLAGAIAIEICGLFIAKTVIRSINWNNARRKSDPHAPVKIASILAGIFFFVVIILSLSIELNPDLAVLMFPGFVAIAICCYGSIAISDTLAKWETDRDQDQDQRRVKTGINAEIKKAQKGLDSIKADLEKLQSERSQLDQDINSRRSQLERLNRQKQADNTPNDTSLDRANDTRLSKKAERMNQVIKLAPDHSQAEIAEILGVSKSTVKRYYKELNGSVK